jgi:predicted alpha/beta-hydrolase family hydrolase
MPAITIRLPVLLESFRDQLKLEGGERPLFLGGQSLGGRVASLLLDALSRGGSAAGEVLGESVRGEICLGYPFHPPGKPERLRTEHLQTLRMPSLILQGERDPF